MARQERGPEQALETTLDTLHKRFGDGSIMKLGTAQHLNVQVIPTGSLAVDVALGVGGVPRGRITEIYGPEGSGKTTLCLHAIAEAQRLGGTAAIIDVEHALDPAYADTCGVNVDELYIAQPDTGEEALEIAEALIRSGAIDILVIDSVAALVPRAEIEGEMGASHPGLQARLMSQALRKLSGAIKQSNTAVMFTNQLRMKIGVMFGNPETTSGGRALRFYASVRLDIRRIQAIKQSGDVVGNRTRIRVTKNKVAPPYRVAEFDIMYNEGISAAGDVLDFATEMDIIQKRGSFYSYNGESLAQGRENCKEVLRDKPALMREIENLVREANGLATLPPIDAEADADASAKEAAEQKEAEPKKNTRSRRATKSMADEDAEEVDEDLDDA